MLKTLVVLNVLIVIVTAIAISQLKIERPLNYVIPDSVWEQIKE